MPRQIRVWTSEEEEVVRNSKLKTSEMAKKLGRSYASVAHKRYRLHQTKDDDLVECQICRKTFRILINHIILGHGWTIEQYKKEFPDGRIVGSNTSQRLATYKGKKRPEHGAKVRRALKGRKPSAQCLAASGKASTKRLKDPEFQAKMQAALEKKRGDPVWAKAYSERVSKGLSEYYQTHDGPNLGRSMPQSKEARLAKCGLRKPRIKITCDWCDEEFERLECYMRGEHNFCSTECHGHWRAKYYVGENAPRWKGGISSEPYPLEFNNKLKESIRKRDQYCCQLCSITQEEHLGKYGRKLSIHHIDYDKKNNDSSNLIALCNICNLKANGDREFYTKLFSEHTGYTEPH